MDKEENIQQLSVSFVLQKAIGAQLTSITDGHDTKKTCDCYLKFPALSAANSCSAAASNSALKRYHHIMLKIIYATEKRVNWYITSCLTYICLIYLHISN